MSDARRSRASNGESDGGTGPAGGSRAAAGESGAATPGRKRDPVREAAILDAALEMLAEGGYEGLSFEGVASRAGAGRATIYRRWSSKQELVAAALAHRASAKESAPDTGSVRGDLVAAISAFGTEEADQEAALVGGLIRAVREDGELRRLMHENVLDGRWEHALPIVERGKRRGELPEGADARLLMEVAAALVYQRVLVHGAPVDEPFVEHCVDDVLLPLLRGGSPPDG